MTLFPNNYLGVRKKTSLQLRARFFVIGVVTTPILHAIWQSSFVQSEWGHLRARH